MREDEEFRNAKADSLMAARAAVFAFEEYKDAKDAATLAAKRCWPCVSPERDERKVLLPMRAERSVAEASKTVNSEEQTRDTAPRASTASKPRAFTPLARVMPLNDGEEEVANSWPAADTEHALAKARSR